MDISPTPSPADLKAQRLAAGISTDEIAEAMEVNPSTVWRWEEGKGKRHPNKHILRAWKVALSELTGRWA